jgi:hypothetical protein
VEWLDKNNMDKKQEELTPVQYNSDKDLDTKYSEFWTRFNEYKEHRNQTVRFFNKGGESRNIIDYVKDSVDRMNEHHPKPEFKDEWQSNVFDPITRNKIVTILSKLVSARMSIEAVVKSNSIFNTEDSKRRASIYTDLLDAANLHNKEHEQLVWEMFTCMTEGTVIGYEGWLKDKRTIKYVKEFDPDTGESKTEETTYDSWDDVYGEIVPIEEFYPETVWASTRDFKVKVKRCFRVRTLSFNGFKDLFGKYDNADQVQPAGYYYDSGYFNWGISEEVGSNNVQVVEWFDEVKDEHKIWCNGVELYDGPMEFNHKKLPFWVAISEPIHQQFLYGKSFPDKLQGMQDMNNAIFNNVLDQLFIVLNSPTFVDGEIDDLDDGYIEPNKIYQMTPGTKIQKGTLGNVDQTSFQVLDLIKRSMEESSTSAQSEGIDTGGRKTRFEVQTLQENSLSVASLLLKMIEDAMQYKYFLRLYNTLQYYSQPSETKDGSKRFKFLVLDNKKLTNGKNGKKLIQIAPSLGDETESQVNNNLKNAANLEMGLSPETVFDPATATVEPIFITKDYLLNKDVELDVRVVPNSSIKETSTQKKNADIAFYQMTAENPQIDQTENLQDLAEAFGKNRDIVKDKQEQEDPLQDEMAKAKGLTGGNGMEGMPAPGSAGVNMDLL